MPTPAATDLNDILERITASESIIEEARTLIANETSGFADHFVSGPWEDELPELDISGLLTQIDQSSSEASTTIVDQLGGAMSTVQVAVEGMSASLDQAITDWTSTATEAETAATEFGASLTREAQRLLDAFGRLEESLRAGDAAWQEAQQSLDTAVQGFCDEVEKTFTTTLHDIATEFLENVTGEQTQLIEQHLADARQSAEAALEALSQASSRLLSDFEQQLQDALKELSDHVSAQVQVNLEQAVREIIEHAVQKILETIMEALLSAQLGATLTSAMSPVLPELIALKRATDVILEAIRIWKDTVGRLGDLF